VLIKEDRIPELLNIEENYFNDVKAKAIKPAKLSETVSAFANASGGDIYIGITENTRTGCRQWDGFPNIETANSIIQMLHDLAPLENFYTVTFLKHPVLNTLVLQLSIMKTATIVLATDNIPYVRHNAQKDPANTPEKLKRLQLDKGIAQFENEVIPETQIEEAVGSEAMKLFPIMRFPILIKNNGLSNKDCKIKPLL
jgi:ATP-dependent DNA helicase RecG